MFKRDIILVHCPSVYDFRERSVLFGPVSDMVPSTPIFEMYPLGFTTLCEYFERHGLRAKLFNLASFMLHKKNFDVEKALGSSSPVPSASTCTGCPTATAPSRWRAS